MKVKKEIERERKQDEKQSKRERRESDFLRERKGVREQISVAAQFYWGKYIHLENKAALGK